jgi:succinate-acetate transporter protein
MGKHTTSNSTYLALLGCLLVFIGWVLALFTYQSKLILSSILTPLSFIVLLLYGNEDMYKQDMTEIAGLSGFVVYIISAFTALVAIYALVKNWDEGLLIYVGSPLLIFVGSLLVVLKFVLNSVETLKRSKIQLDQGI